MCRCSSWNRGCRVPEATPNGDAAPAGHVVCCPDKLRGALSAPAAAAALAEGVRSVGLTAREHPLADGGEGTLEAVARADGARLREHVVRGALGELLSAQLALLADGDVVVELAQAAGHAAPDAPRDVLQASTAGVGELIRHALDAGARTVIVALGGSATVDGGLGALRELGACLYAADGRELRGCGADLLALARIDASQLDPRLHGALVFAADVESPLHGPRGAAHVFAAQKGATPAQVDAFDAALVRLASLLGPACEQPGAGAAGGFPAPFLAHCAARIVSGAAFVRERTGFAAALDGAAACVTGEGTLDASSAQGKTVAGVVAEGRAREIPVFVVGGVVEDDGAVALYEAGAAAVLPLGRRPRTLTEALAEAAEDLRFSGAAIGRLTQLLTPRTQEIPS